MLFKLLFAGLGIAALIMGIRVLIKQEATAWGEPESPLLGFLAAERDGDRTVYRGLAAVLVGLGQIVVGCGLLYAAWSVPA